jgi:phage shock protein A
MKILSRFTDIMSANINSALSKAEAKNADKLLEKYLQDAKNDLGQVKAETAAVIAEEMGLARKLTENEAARNKQENYALAAVKSGNDNDARKFLVYKEHLEKEGEDLTASYERAKENSEKMRQLTIKLMNDIQAAEAKMRELKQKLSVAKTQEKLNKLEGKLGQSSMGGFDNLFDAVQKRVDAADAAANLNKEFAKEANEMKDLAKKYDDMTSQTKADSIEDQLARLKAGLGQQ